MKKKLLFSKKYKIYEGEYIVPDVDFQSFYEHHPPELPKSFIEKYLIIMIQFKCIKKFNK